MSGGGASSSYSQDTLPPSMDRRSSFDFTHHDSLTLLDPTLIRGGGSANTNSTSGSTRSAAALPATLFKAATIAHITPTQSRQRAHEPDEKDDDDDDDDDVRDLSHVSSSHYGRVDLRRAATSMSAPTEYRSLGQKGSVHFEDVLREKTTTADSESQSLEDAEAEGDAASGRPLRGRGLCITVTGELLEPVKTARKCPDTMNTNAGFGRRRNQGEDDSKEGSVQRFHHLDDFLRDEERRRQKYDAAVAAHQVCMDNAATAAAASAASSASASVDPSDDSASSKGEDVSSDTNTPSPAPHGSEPLAQTPLWISVEDGSDDVIEQIGRYFGLHPLTIEDCQSRGIREKLEVFPEYLFLVFHALEDTNAATSSSSSLLRHHSGGALGNLVQDQLTTEVMKNTPLKLVIFPSLVLSFHKNGLASVHTVRKQLDKLYRNRVLNTAWLIHGLLDVVSDSLMPIVDKAAKEADDMEDLIYIVNPGRESHRDVLKRIGFIARRLTFLRQRLWSKRDILTSLIERDWQFFLTGVKVPYLRDIYDHLVIMLHKLDSAIEVIVTLQSTYLSVVSIDVAAVSNDGNKAMKTLSASATILLPLSLIASLMGMNVFVPGDSALTVTGRWPTFRELLPFSTICICMVIISFYLYAYFKKRQYL